MKHTKDFSSFGHRWGCGRNFLLPIIFLRYIFLLHLDHVQQLPDDQGSQFLCLFFYLVLIKQLPSNKHLVCIFIASYNHLFLLRQLEFLILLCIYPLSFGSKYVYIIVYVWCILLVIFTEV